MEEMEGMELQESEQEEPEERDWKSSRRSRSRISHANSAGFSCFRRRIFWTICGVVTCLGLEPPMEPGRTHKAIGEEAREASGHAYPV